MNNLTKQLSKIIKAALPKECTSVSYAIMQHGEIVAADALGNQGGKDKKKADLSCTYNVASVSKIYCTVAVMQLVEKGMLKLDEPLCSYLPRFNMPMDERYRKITLRHCLSHTSGLPGTQWRGFSVSSVEGADYYSDVYDYLSKSTLKAEPGEYAVYCNDGFTLAEMVVAQVSGVPFAQYCMENIAEKIGAHSTRHSSVINKEHPLIREGKKPRELLLIQGGAGITTSMTDLCRFGELFLKENSIISEESKKEMASHQGKTFLKRDDRTELYGLGWDNVDFRHEDYDLGEGVLLKGGNSFQFDTQFLIVPEYDAVLAISETHDCKLNINAMILRLFATMLLQQGVNIYTKYKLVPKEIIDKYSGTYLMPSCAAQLRIDGAVADFVRKESRGHESLIYHDLWWDGEAFNGENNQKFFFEESEGNTFLMTSFRTRSFGAAMKAEVPGQVNKAWKNRKGKDYVVCDIDANDIVIYEIMTGFRVTELQGFEGIYQLSFSGRSDGGVYGMFDAPVHAVDDNIGKGFLRTPTNPSRDLVDPIFHVEDGIEFCDVASYTYKAAASLPEYEGQAFPIERRKNGVYSIKQELKALPEIPEGHRILILNKEMVSVYDSLFDEKYTPVKEGYIILV